MKRIITLVTVALVMAVIMAFGAGAAFADAVGISGHRGTVGDCHMVSGGSGGPGGGSGGVSILCAPEGEPQTQTVSGGGGDPGGGAGGRCEAVDLPYDAGGPFNTEAVGSRDCPYTG